MDDPVLFENEREEEAKRPRTEPTEMLSGEKEEKAKEERRRRETWVFSQSSGLSLSPSLSDLPMIDDAMRMGGA